VIERIRRQKQQQPQQKKLEIKFVSCPHSQQPQLKLFILFQSQLLDIIRSLLLSVLPLFLAMESLRTQFSSPRNNREIEKKRGNENYTLSQRITGICIKMQTSLNNTI
jgi:hypothetical protein